MLFITGLVESQAALSNSLAFNISLYSLSAWKFEISSHVFSSAYGIVILHFELFMVGLQAFQVVLQCAL